MHYKKNIKIVAHLKTEARAEEFRQAYKESKIEENYPDTTLNITIGAFSNILSAFEHAIDILIVDINLEDPSEIERIHRVLSPQSIPRSLIATSARAGMNELRRLMQQGFVDFVPQPFQPHDLDVAIRAAFNRADAEINKAKKGPNVISLAKAFGGAGTTTIGVLIAEAINTIIKDNDNGKRICFVDLDYYFGNSSIYFDIDPMVNYGILNRDSNRIDYELLSSMISNHNDRLDVLASPMSSSVGSEPTPQAVGRILEVISEYYDYVIVDMPKGKQPWTDGVLLGSDIVLMVFQYTVAAVRQTAALLNHYAKADFAECDIRLVLNRFSETWGPSKQALSDLENALSRKVNYLLPNDYPAVVGAHNKGKPVESRRLLESVQSLVTDVLSIRSQDESRDKSKSVLQKVLPFKKRL